MEPLFEDLAIGKTYRAVGPIGKNGPPAEVKIVGVSDRGYRTEGKRQPATLIAFGCERYWREVAPEVAEVLPV